jgi:hypothetical protein
MSMTLILLLAAASPEQAPAKIENNRPFATARSLDSAELARQTAREDIAQIANSEQAATASRNTVEGQSQTGNATFADNAFQNVSGFTVVNANTGNNSAINGAIVVNVTITPAQ